MKVLLTLVVLVACVYLGQANDCVDSSVLCKYRSGVCSDNEWYSQLCPLTCGKCKPSTLYRFTYFDLRARGEQIRWILEQGDANWQDIRIKQADWPAIKPTTKTGQLPFLEVRNVTIAQSAAIAMYLAEELNLAGSNNLEAAEVQMVWETVQEAFNAAVGVRFATKDDKKAKQEDYDKNKFPLLVKFLEGRLNNGQEWLVGDKVSAADIVTASLLDTQTGKAAEMVKASKTLSALTNKVKELPRIKNWIANRPKNDF